MPEMPRERRNRLKGEWGFNDLEMRDVLNADALDLLEETVKAGASAAGAKKWWLGELSREANNKGVSLEELPITPADVAEVEKLIADGKLNDKLAKQTVAGVLAGEGTPDEVVKKHGFQVVSDDGALEKAVDEALAANPDIVEKLKSGNMKPMGAIIGAVMRATRGQADAKAVTKIVMSRSSNVYNDYLRLLNRMKTHVPKKLGTCVFLSFRKKGKSIIASCFLRLPPCLSIPSYADRGRCTTIAAAPIHS